MRARFLFPGRSKDKLAPVLAAIQAAYPELNARCVITYQKDGTPTFGEVLSDAPIPEMARLALRATIDLIYQTDAWVTERDLKWVLAEICLRKQ